MLPPPGLPSVCAAALSAFSLRCSEAGRAISICSGASRPPKIVDLRGRVKTRSRVRDRRRVVGLPSKRGRTSRGPGLAPTILAIIRSRETTGSTSAPWRSCSRAAGCPGARLRGALTSVAAFCGGSRPSARRSRWPAACWFSPRRRRADRVSRAPPEALAWTVPQGQISTFPDALICTSLHNT